MDQPMDALDILYFNFHYFGQRNFNFDILSLTGNDIISLGTIGFIIGQDPIYFKRGDVEYSIYSVY